MTCVDIRADEFVAAVPPAQARARPRPVRRRREVLWRWLAESAIVFPGGAITYMLLTTEED